VKTQRPAADEKAGIVRRALAIGAAAGLFGLSFGALATAAGIGVAEACALSFLVYGGASQGWRRLAAAGCFGMRLAGLCAPAPVFERRHLRRAADLMPVALLTALIAIETVGQGRQMVLDARLAGLAAAALAVRARWPFLAVVAISAAVTAGLRLAG